MGYLGFYLAATLDRADNCGFVSTAAPLAGLDELPVVALTGFSANVGLVGFDNAL